MKEFKGAGRQIVEDAQESVRDGTNLRDVASVVTATRHSLNNSSTSAARSHNSFHHIQRYSP